MAVKKNLDIPKNDTIIKIRDLCFYRDERAIFKNVDIDVPRGSITAVMGPSGTGKTTLLRLIGGQLRPDKGVIEVDGRNVPALNRNQLFDYRKGLGMLFQSGALLTDMTIYDNVAFPVREHTLLTDDLIHHLVLMKLNAVGLRGAKNLYPSELSGGMQRRAALARAIALDPNIIMYDEPFSGQDPISMGVLLKLIRTLNDVLGMTTVIVSHDVQEAAAIADYIYILSEGKVIQASTPAKLKESRSEAVQQFMQGLPDGPVSFHYPAPNYCDDLVRR